MDLVISIGSPKSGKSYRLRKYILNTIDTDTFDKYHLILSDFKVNDYRYNFLKSYKNVFVYNNYHEFIAKRVLELAEDKHIMVAIDDITAQICEDQAFCKLLTCNEHLKAYTFYLCVSSGEVAKKNF